LTDSLFFDTDGISAFLWIRDESLLTKLYPGKIVIPKPVYVELSNPCVSHLRQRIDNMISSNQAVIQDINVGTEAFGTYNKLTLSPDSGHKVIGKGEAASIALAKEAGGIVASNNFSDISYYINEYKLKHITTGDILVEAYNKNIITEQQGNSMWASMLAKHRKIGAKTFSDYLKDKKQ